MNQSCWAEDFLFDSAPIHPSYIAKLIPSMTESEVDYADIVDIDECKKRKLQVHAKELDTGNVYGINYKEGLFKLIFY